MRGWDYLILLVTVGLFVIWFYTQQNWLRYAVWAACGVYFFRRLWVGFRSMKE